MCRFDIVCAGIVFLVSCVGRLLVLFLCWCRCVVLFCVVFRLFVCPCLHCVWFAFVFGLAVVLRRFWFGFVLLCLCCVFVVCFAVVFASVLVLCLDCLFGCCCDVGLT